MRKIIETDHNFDFGLEDVEQLNKFAIKGDLDIVKVSYGVLPYIYENYYILNCGGALGHGNGPIVVSKNKISKDDLKGKRVAIPGEHTTAFMLFKHFFGTDFEFLEFRFDKIFDAIKDDIVDVGIVIHEGRFIYDKLGFFKVTDLGEEWEKRYFIPIPLGAIVVNKRVFKYIPDIKSSILSSIDYSFRNFNESKDFCKKYSQELDDDILENHINFFVNEYSFDMSKFTKQISTLLKIPEKQFI